jgi:purine-cytosine permease-like protein
MILAAARGGRHTKGTGYMASTKDLRDEKLRIIICMIIAIPALAAVPFVGTRYGDFNEFIALVIGVAPIIYLVFFATFNLNRRIAALEQKK